MAQISKKPIPKEVNQKIFESFYRAIDSLSDKETRFFINDLLTKTERMMIPKRFAVAVLLSEGRSYDSIRETLGVTQTTISSVSRLLENSAGINLAIEKLKRTEAWNDWWKGVERLFYRVGTPGKAFLDDDEVKRRLRHKKKTLV